MKTNYGRLGQEALFALNSSSKQAESVQTRLLIGLLRRNQDTEYGKKYGFGEIKSPLEYQKMAPLSVYADYEGYIRRMIDGENGLLTKEPAIYYCISSGTTGEAKYLPLTETDLRLQYIYAYGVPFGMARNYYKGLCEEEVFGDIFQIGEFAKTSMENGVMNGIRSGCVYQWLDRDGEFDAGDYCVPKEVLFPKKLEDLLYVKARFALARRSIRAIHGVFINRVAGVMDYIWRNWETLLFDMEHGGVDSGVCISQKWREFVTEKLPPNPARAKELRLLSYERLKCGMVKKIWPNARYILAIGGRAFSYYTKKMETYAGDVPIYHYAYAASEGIFGVAERMGRADAYILFPQAGFFEFLPLLNENEKEKEEEEKEQGRPLFLWELRLGGRYELIFTNHSGLYRYCMGDVVQVVGWYEKAPVVRFCYRKNQIMNIAGEKSNQEQLAEAIRQFSVRMNCEITGYCVREDVSDVLPGYLFYLECQKPLDCPLAYAQEVLDECLCGVNYEYLGCRRMKEIKEARICYLMAGSFGRYEQYLEKIGRQTGQNKQVCILNTKEKIQFFDRHRLDG